MKRTLTIAMILALASGSAFAAGQREAAAPDTRVFEATFAHVVRPTIAKGLAADRFAELVKQRSNGRLLIKVYPDSQMGTDREITEQMQLGDIQFNAPFTGVLPAFVPQTQLFDLPFAFASSEAAYRAMHGPVGEALNPFLLQQGLRVLGYWDGGFKHITNNIRPIKTPEDIAGMRVRISQSPLLKSQFEALNSNPVDIAFAELYTALQQGTVDGQENTLANIFTRRFYEAQKYMTLTAHGYLGYAFLVSESFYQKLPADLRKIVDEAAAEVSTWQWAKAREEDLNFLNQLRKTNIEITELTPAQKQAFLEKTRPVYGVFERTVPGAKALIEALDKSRR